MTNNGEAQGEIKRLESNIIELIDILKELICVSPYHHYSWQDHIHNRLEAVEKNINLIIAKEQPDETKILPV
jgi:hypothetical protein